MTTPSFHIPRLETDRLTLTFQPGHWAMRGFGMWTLTKKDADKACCIVLAKHLGAILGPNAEQPKGRPCQVWRHQTGVPQ